MTQRKKLAETTKRPRAKSLNSEQIKELIRMWPDHSVDEFAANYGVGRGLIEKIAREVRKQNPAYCQKKRNDLSKKVALALRQLSAENKEQDEDLSQRNIPPEERIVSLLRN